MYEKGIETKKNIYMTAKQLFYEYGYRKTTIRLIAKHANVPIGLITYHFKNKDNIVKDIYNDYINNIFLLLDSSTEENIKSTLLRQITGLRIYYNNILIDENNSNFFYEQMLKNSNFRILFDTVERNYKKILNEFNIFIPSNEYRAYIISEFGARHELLLSYFSGNLDFSIQELVDVISCIAPRLFKIDHNIVNSMLYSSMKIFKSLDDSTLNDVKFLV
ncbi:MAG: TetR/AcrR family transcriptional regulator [Eubacteriaceae bacterium]